MQKGRTLLLLGGETWPLWKNVAAEQNKVPLLRQLAVDVLKKFFTQKFMLRGKLAGGANDEAC